jgi:DNA-directed RNA polymerase specialized sigma24 family protein
VDESEVQVTYILKRLHPDSAEAERQLLKIQRKLVNFFEWNLRHSAEDLAQETLRRVMDRLRDPAANIYVPIEFFCIGVARNVLKEARKAKPETPVDSEMLDSLQQLASSSYSTPYEERVYDELLSQCRRVVREEDIELIQEWEYTTAAELARRFSTTEGAIRIRIYHIRRKLREVLGGKSHEAKRK